MSYARIITIGRGTVIRTVKLEDGQTTEAVDHIATTLSSIIENERDILKVEVDYTGCNDSDVITHYDP